MQARRRGRPTVGERVSLGLRVTPDMKRRLDTAAKESGRSQSQEAELRLERSFDRQDLLGEVLTLAYGKEAADSLMKVGSWLRGTVKARDGAIAGDTFVFILEGDADEAVLRVVKNRAPGAGRSLPETISVAIDPAQEASRREASRRAVAEAGASVRKTLARQEKPKR